MEDCEFEIPSWADVYEMLLGIATKVMHERFKLDTIVGVSRGGWVPTRILSDLLGTKNLALVGIEFYDVAIKMRENPVLTRPVTTPVQSKNILLVDDVVDTGATLQLAKKHLLGEGAEAVKTATIYYKPTSSVKPDCYGKLTRSWVIFPWDLKETIRNLFWKSRNSICQIEAETEDLIEAGAPKHLLTRFLKEISEEDRSC